MTKRDAKIIPFPSKSSTGATPGVVVDGSAVRETAPVEKKPRGESAGAHIDKILRTDTSAITFRGKPGYGTAQSKAIRDLFRDLGWSKFFRVTKGGFSLGTNIEWANGYKPNWICEKNKADRIAAANGPVYHVPHCYCDTCKTRESQRAAIGKRVHHVLNKAFVAPGARAFGDRSDSMTDYFDSDYNFHA